MLHHENAPSHTSVLTLPFLAKDKMAVIPHPPHSPDLAPCDFFLFPKMKLKLKGLRFDTTEESQAESQTVLDTLTENDFQEAFQKWINPRILLSRAGNLNVLKLVIKNTVY
jgi:hypothetical protein